MGNDFVVSRMCLVLESRLFVREENTAEDVQFNPSPSYSHAHTHAHALSLSISPSKLVTHTYIHAYIHSVPHTLPIQCIQPFYLPFFFFRDVRHLVLDI